MTTRPALIAIALAAGCGGAGPRIAPPPVVAPTAVAYEAARSATLGVIAADETHVYWVDAGIHGRAHGGETPPERLFVSDGWIDRLAVGDHDVFFVIDGYRLRAIPKSGGAPSELAGLDGGATGLVADGDGVWVLTGTRLERWSREPDERRLELPGDGAALAIDGGEAFVTSRDGEAALHRIDLATGKATAMSTDWGFAEAFALAVSGTSVVAAGPGGVLAIPRRGGAARYALTLPTYAIASDRAGYLVSTDTALVAHPRGAPPRLVAASAPAWTTGGSPGVALTEAYAYHVAYATDTGELVLRGEPRAAGPELLRVPSGAELTALTADGDRAWAGLAHPDGSAEIVELTGKGRRAVVVEGWIEDLRVDGDAIAWWMSGVLYRAERGRAILRSEELYGPPLALHRGNVYWSDGDGLRAIRLDGGAPPIALAPDVTEPGVAIGFADDHLYWVDAHGESPGLRRLDERGRVETSWTYPGDERLAPDLAIVGDAAYLHDGRRVYRVPPGGAPSVIRDDPEVWVHRLFAVGRRLVAWSIRADTLHELVELSTDGGPPRVLWTGPLAGGAETVAAPGATAVFAYSYELGAVLRIAVE